MNTLNRFFKVILINQHAISHAKQVTTDRYSIKAGKTTRTHTKYVPLFYLTAILDTKQD